MDAKAIVAEVLDSEGERTIPDLHRRLAVGGPVSVEGNAWFIDVDDAHERVHVYHESIPHLDAEMSVDEFFSWAHEVLGG